MFDDEDEGFFEGREGDLNEDRERFEAFLAGAEMGFLDSDRWEALVDHYIIGGQYQKALTCAEEALSQFSFNQIFKLRKAQAFSALGQLKEAIRLLSELERFGMPSFELLLTKASVFSQLKDSTNAIRYFRAALKEAEPEDRDEVYIDLAMEYVNRNDWKNALKVLKEAIEANPSNESAIYEIAYCYDQLGDYEQSIKCYSDFIDDNPYSFTAWYNLGNAYLKMEDHEQAIWAYDYCTLINDEFGPVYFNMGNAYLSTERFTKAIEAFLKSNELDGDDPSALCYIGECHEQLGELDLAKKYYRLALDLAPSLPDAWLGLGIVEDLEGRTKEGLTLIHKALELAPENAGIYHVLAGAYEKLEEFEKAQENYEMALAIEPDDEECLLNYVELLCVESAAVALSFVEDFEQTVPENALLPIIKVNLLWQVGEKDLALSLFKYCLEVEPEKAEQLFEINPSLKTVPEFVLLGD